MDRWFTGSLVRWIIGLMDHWFDGSLVWWIFGSMDLWFDGSVVCWFDGLMDQWIAGSMDSWFDGSMVRWFDGSLVWCWLFSGDLLKAIWIRWPQVLKTKLGFRTIFQNPFISVRECLCSRVFVIAFVITVQNHNCWHWPDLYQRRIIRHTVINNPSKYKSEDEFWRIICLDINRSRVSRRVSRCWAEWKPGESLNMAALVALLMKSRRTALDMAVYQRRISSVKRMFEPENSLMNFMLPFSLANLAQDRKTRSRDEIRNKKWWEDGLQNWS